MPFPFFFVTDDFISHLCVSSFSSFPTHIPVASFIPLPCFLYHQQNHLNYRLEYSPPLSLYNVFFFYFQSIVENILLRFLNHIASHENCCHRIPLSYHLRHGLFCKGRGGAKAGMSSFLFQILHCNHVSR